MISFLFFVALRDASQRPEHAAVHASGAGIVPQDVGRWRNRSCLRDWTTVQKRGHRHDTQSRMVVLN